MDSRKTLVYRVILVLVAFSLVTGCSQRLELQEEPLAQARIARLGPMCKMYAMKNNQKKPTSIDELKAWVKKLSKAELEQFGIDDPETAFISPRDNQPFVLVKSAGSGPGDVLAYEKVGEGGKHYIVTPLGRAFELDEPELKRRVPSAK